MRVGILFILLTVITAPRVLADFETASSAYKSQNYDQAYQAFSELARAGDARAQTVLAIMHKYGESVAVDMGRAFHWYQKAADQGYPPAIFNVGTMLLEGTGTAQDEVAGEAFIRRAAEAGFERAKDKLAELNGSRLILHDEEPVAWSQSWNLRIPNNIRESDTTNLTQARVYRVQVGAMSSLLAAENLWQELYANNEDLFDGQQPIFRQGQSGERMVYRIQIGPFDERSAAGAFCEDYKQHFTNRLGCLVVKTY